jgi:hypothetical protein
MCWAGLIRGPVLRLVPFLSAAVTCQKHRLRLYARDAHSSLFPQAPSCRRYVKTAEYEVNLEEWALREGGRGVTMTNVLGCNGNCLIG